MERLPRATYLFPSLAAPCEIGQAELALFTLLFFFKAMLRLLHLTLGSSSIL